MELAARIKQWAGELGFDLAGIAPVESAETRRFYEAWVAAGHAGEMGYMAREPARRGDPRLAWQPAASVVVVGLSYKPGVDAVPDDGLRGQVARYALGDDYHEVLAAKLRALLSRLRQQEPAVEGRCYVDTGPLLERDLAARAGLGWFGKNTMLLNRRQGSYF